MTKSIASSGDRRQHVERRQFASGPMPRFSRDDAMPFDAPEFQAAKAKAAGAVLAAIAEFERTTRRTVYGVHLLHIDVTTLESPEAVAAREVYVLWHETRAEHLQRDDA